jgi:hypothetical protein
MAKAATVGHVLFAGRKFFYGCTLHCLLSPRTELVHILRTALTIAIAKFIA